MFVITRISFSINFHPLTYLQVVVLILNVSLHRTVNETSAAGVSLQGDILRKQGNALMMQKNRTTKEVFIWCSSISSIHLSSLINMDQLTVSLQVCPMAAAKDVIQLINTSVILPGREHMLCV